MGFITTLSLPPQRRAPGSRRRVEGAAGSRGPPAPRGRVPLPLQRRGGRELSLAGFDSPVGAKQRAERAALKRDRPPLHPSGARTGAQAWNGAEMATAGVTDSAPGASEPSGPGRADGPPGLPRASPSAAGGRGHRSSGGPNRPRGGISPPPPARAGLPTPEARRARPRTSPGRGRWCVPIPKLNTPLLTGPAGSARRAPKKGAQQEPPPSGGELGLGFLTPSWSAEDAESNLLLPTHLSRGPVFGSGSSGVRAAATCSPRLP